MAGVSLGKALQIELGQPLGATITPQLDNTPSEIFPTSWRRAWFRADQGVTQAGSRVSAWANVWGNGNLAQATGSAQPLFTAGGLSGRDCISNDDGARIMNGTMTTTIAVGGQFWMWCFCRPLLVATGKYLCALTRAGGLTPYTGIRSVTSGTVKWTSYMNDGSSHVDSSIASVTADTTTPRLHETGMVVSAGKFYFATSGVAYPGTVTTWSLTPALAQMFLFYEGSSASVSMRADVCEFGVVAGTPTTAQRQALLQYVAARYGAV